MAEENITKQQWEVYETVNLQNGKTYIGQHRHTTTCLGPKLTRTCKYKGSGVAILKAIRKYGVNAFERRIIAIVDNQSEADRVERDQILLGIAEGRCQYNLYTGHRVESPAINRNNSNRTKPYRHSEEQKAKIQNASKAKWSDEKGRQKMMKNHNTVISENLLEAARNATIKVWANKESALLRRMAVRAGNLKRNHLLGKHATKSNQDKTQKNREENCPLCCGEQ